MIGVGLLYLVNYPDEDIRVDTWLGLASVCLSLKTSVYFYILTKYINNIHIYMYVYIYIYICKFI